MNEKEVFEQNELKANKAIAFTSVIIAACLAVLFVLSFVCGEKFAFSETLVKYMRIAFPILIVCLLLPVCLLKTKLVKKEWFKYVVLSFFVCATACVCLVLPNTAVLMWAVPVSLVTLYFNPKLTRIIFIEVVVLLIASSFASVALGSWNQSLMLAGDVGSNLNPYLACLLFMLLPKLILLVILSQIANGLSLRSKLILNERIKEAQHNEKINSQLGIASAIQSAILPKEFPDSSRGEIYAIMDSAKEIGGDFYDFFDVDEKHLAFVIGDASGKGIPSALYMMKAQSLVRGLTLANKKSPAQIMEQVNNIMCEGNDLNLFVTCWLGILDKESGDLVYVNAGHNPAIVKQDGKYGYLSAKPGLVLGGFKGFKFEDSKVKLSKGDKILLYTNGITEAHNVRSELYGEEKFFEFVSKFDGSPFETITKVREDVREFSRNAEQNDDITMLMLEYRKPQSVFAKKFLAKKENLEEVQDFILRSIKTVLSPKDKNQLLICIEEIFINIASYSYEDSGFVEIEVNLENNELTLVFKDNGVKFDPLAKEDPDTKASAEDRGVGGLGIFMVKNLMDKCYYEYKDNKNILTLTKRY